MMGERSLAAFIESPEPFMLCSVACPGAGAEAQSAFAGTWTGPAEESLPSFPAPSPGPTAAPGVQSGQNGSKGEEAAGASE